MLKNINHNHVQSVVLFHYRSLQKKTVIPQMDLKDTPAPLKIPNTEARHSPILILYIRNGVSPNKSKWTVYGHILKPVKRSSLRSEDKVFGARFHYKIKRKNGKFDKCKVRLVVQGQHMRKCDSDGVGDFDDAFSPVHMCNMPVDFD